MLSDAERASLEALSRKRTASQSLAERARIVLACAEEGGVAPLTRVAERTGTSRETVRKWRVRFTQGRVGALADAPRPGAPRTITDEQVEVLDPDPDGEGTRAGHALVDPVDGRRDGAFAVEKHPRFHLHFTPTSSSWLNLVEHWFAELTSRKLRRSAHRSVTELEADISKRINEWNKDPRPFTWTKSADDILETIAEYCQRACS